MDRAKPSEWKSFDSFVWKEEKEIIMKSAARTKMVAFCTVYADTTYDTDHVLYVYPHQPIAINVDDPELKGYQWADLPE